MLKEKELENEYLKAKFFEVSTASTEEIKLLSGVLFGLTS